MSFNGENMSIKCPNKIEVVTLDKEQWEQIYDLILKIKEEMTRKKEKWESVTYFSSIHDMLIARKIVTLNGKSMLEGARIKNPRAKRISDMHLVFKLPNGTFAVSSQKLNESIRNRISVIFRDDQIDCFDITKYLNR